MGGTAILFTPVYMILMSESRSPMDCLPVGWVVKNDPGFGWDTIFDEDGNRLAWVNDNGMIEGVLPPKYAVAMVLALGNSYSWVVSQNGTEGDCGVIQLTQARAFSANPTLRQDTEGNSLYIRATFDERLSLEAARKVKNLVADELRKVNYEPPEEDDYEEACTNVTAAVIEAERSLHQTLSNYETLLEAERTYCKEAPEGVERDVGIDGVARAEVILNVLKALAGRD